MLQKLRLIAGAFFEAKREPVPAPIPRPSRRELARLSSSRTT
ncbi:hypothetical protein ACFSLT_01875 [Novosphingobium resinovorum]